MSLPAGAKVGPYEIVALLGAGGMGEVYRGRDSRLGRDVALKVLLPKFAADSERMARFHREAQVLASLNHPHIAALYGLEESGAVRALVMELVEGPTLAERIKRRPIPIEEALPIARQIAEAFEAAHERGIIHRDLKPANVKLTHDGAVKVLDFGLAKALDDRPAPGSDPANSPTLTLGATVSGAVLGTAAYMSPEQAKGKTVDRRADIWAFGVVLMEMLTGKILYSGETAPETLAAVIMATPGFDALPAETPASIRRLLRRCLEKDPRRRLRDIGEARIMLEEAATEAPAEPQVQAPGPRRALPWVIAAAAVVLSPLVAYLYFHETQRAERALQYSIQAPEKTRMHSFAISPDGRYLAIAAAAEGKRQLWIRPLDTLDAQPLRGTEDAASPFWSPDSRSIGFFAEGKLKRIAVEGGPAQILCDAQEVGGGTWNQDGIIVFNPAAGGPLHRVAAVGGVPAPMTSRGLFPRFLPDGRRFLYVSRGEQGAGVYVASLDAQPVRRVLAGFTAAAWLPPQAGSKNGYLLFGKDNTLMAQPFNPKTLQPDGELFPVAEQVTYYFSISGNGVLVYRRGAGFGLGENQLVWYDRAGKALGNVGAPARTEEFALSPDEKRVAAPRRSGAGPNSDIWLYELARGADTRFTHDAAENDRPVWSPDGRRIVYRSNRGGSYDLYIKDTTGAGQDELLLKGGQTITVAPSDWSRDGRFLLYTQVGPSPDLWVLPMQGDPKPVPFLRSPFTESQGLFSPDGHWIAYSSDESGPYEVYVRPFPPGPGKWKVSIGGGELPRWSRDGKELFYLSPEHSPTGSAAIAGRTRKLMAAAVKAAPGAQPVFEPAVPQALFDVSVPAIMPGRNTYVYAVAADGKRFLVNTRVGDVAETPLTVVVNWLAAVKK